MNDINTKEVAMLRRRVDATRLDEAIAQASESLVALQHPDGHWVFELEADVTIPSEFILLQHYFGRIEPELQARIARYIRAIQGPDGGWPLFHGGALDLSASVKAYFALKAAGDPVDAPHMERARAAILAGGGARRCNVFTRILIALFGEVPWRAVPVMPVEIMLLPNWSPFHIAKVSYWSRTVLVPLLVLMALRPRARNPLGITVRELFLEPPEAVRDWIGGPTSSPLSVAFGMLDWLETKQVLEVVGDWASARPGLRPGGWAFQFENPYYPDLDDTAAVALALDRFGSSRYRVAIDRAAEWVIGMQSRGGGWGSFDADNTHFYLNHIPFADHGALLDPPTADVSGRCLSFLTQIGYGRDHPAVAAAIDYLRAEQEPDGSWFGRWGTNYIYGTWSVLTSFNSAGLPADAPEVRRAVDWLVARQHKDGGWGEGGESYWTGGPHGEAPYSTSSQTAWALLALMAAGEVCNPAVARGIAYLVESQDEDGNWDEPWYTAVGFPRVFYLRYHGYRAFFPLWALARFRRLSRGNSRQVPFGI